MSHDTEPGAPGTLWSEGIHQVWFNKKPIKLKVPQYTIPKAYQKFKETIAQNGGIPLGIDHLPDELLAAYPVLGKLDLHNVGRITEVGTDGNRIYATKSEHTNPLISELYNKGELKSFSVVAPIITDLDETGEANYVFNGFKKIKRMDYVDEGGCIACKVDAVPDGMILTAKLSTEDDKLTDTEEQTQTEQTEQNEQTEAASTTEATNESTEQTEQADQAEAETTEGSAEFDPKQFKADILGEIKGMITDAMAGKTQEVEAKLADLELEAKSSRIEAKIDQKIMEGTLTPAMKEGLLQAGLAMEGDDFDKHLDTYKAKLWDPKQYGNLEAGKSKDKKYNYDDYKRTCEENGIKP